MIGRFLDWLVEVLRPNTLLFIYFIIIACKEEISDRQIVMSIIICTQMINYQLSRLKRKYGSAKEF